MQSEPVNIHAALASFDDIYSPRIVARMNDLSREREERAPASPAVGSNGYEVRIAHARGEHLWHTHPDTDEFFLVLDGQFDIALRTPDGAETTVTLRHGDTFVVPRGTEHRPSSPGASILMFEPSGTSSTGDYTGELPSNVDSTTGREL